MRESHEKNNFLSYMDGFEFKTIYFSVLSFIKIHWLYDGNEYETTYFIVTTVMKRFDTGVKSMLILMIYPLNLEVVHA